MTVTVCRALSMAPVSDGVLAPLREPWMAVVPITSTMLWARAVPEVLSAAASTAVKQLRGEMRCLMDAPMSWTSPSDFSLPRPGPMVRPIIRPAGLGARALPFPLRHAVSGPGHPAGPDGLLHRR